MIFKKNTKQTPKIITVIPPSLKTVEVIIQSYAKKRNYTHVSIARISEFQAELNNLHEDSVIITSLPLQEPIRPILEHYKPKVIFISDDEESIDPNMVRRFKFPVKAIIRRSNVKDDVLDKALRSKLNNDSESKQEKLDKLIEAKRNTGEQNTKLDINSNPESPYEELLSRLRNTLIEDPEEKRKETNYKNAEESQTSYPTIKINKPEASDQNIKTSEVNTTKEDINATEEDVNIVPDIHFTKPLQLNEDSTYPQLINTVLFTSSCSHNGTSILSFNTAYFMSAHSPDIDITLLDLSFPPRIQITYRLAEVKLPFKSKPEVRLAYLKNTWQTFDLNDLYRESIKFPDVNIRVVQAFSDSASLLKRKPGDIQNLIRLIKSDTNVLFINAPNLFIMRHPEEIVKEASVIFDVIKRLKPVMADNLIEMIVFRNYLLQNNTNNAKIITIFNKDTSPFENIEEEMLADFKPSIRMPNHIFKNYINIQANRVIDYSIPILGLNDPNTDFFSGIENIYKQLSNL
ncbi:MAG: hypothetical protein QW735_03305 [archaeon]